MTLHDLEQEEVNLMSLLKENRKKQSEIRKSDFVSIHGVNIGDAVEFVDGGNIKRGVISNIEDTYSMYYSVYLFNADGKLGKRKVRIYRTDSIKKI